MRIFLAGGTGFVGSHLRCSLLETGHELRLLTHRRQPCGEPDVERVFGDATRADTYVSALQGCDAVINLIGIIREFPGRGVTFERLHVEATRNLVHAARTSGIRRFLQMSALGTRPDAVSPYHRTKYRAEQEVRSSGLDWTIFRPSVIFGPRDEFINRLAGLVRSLPIVPLFGDGGYRLQPIDAGDVARCFTMALGMPETVGKTYELCGRDRIAYRDLLDTIGRVLGRQQVPKLSIPFPLAEWGARLLQRLPFFPITLDQIRMLLEECTCDQTWRETFRFEPVGLEEGIRVYLR